MAKTRHEKTLADYLAIAIGPLLIMALVGSLVFFLLEVSYAGEHATRLRWILFWFVVAIVLVARIGIEQGREHAAAYGLALAAATSLVIFKFASSFAIGAIVLLAIVWWCANKLTWDCTLIDDSQDASGEGLLQASGLDSSVESAAVDNRRSGRAGFWKRLLLNAGEEEGRPHAPGLWVVYFSLAALPLFGIGQALIPPSDGESRRTAFQFLAIYVTAGLGLLLTTSFLGLRRYLRQRKLRMPATMAATWMAVGAVLIVSLLALCLLLPRPDAHYSLTAMLDRAAEEAQPASRFGQDFDDAGQGEGRRVGRGAKEGEEPADEGQKGQGGRQAGDGQGRPQGDGQGRKPGQGGEQKQGEKAASGQGQERGNDQEQRQGQTEPGQKGQGNESREQRPQDGRTEGSETENGGPSDSPPSATSPEIASGSALAWVLTLARYAIYAVLALAVLYFLVRYWSEVMGLFAGRRDRRRTDAPEPVTAARRKPFSEFANPFATGAAQQMSPEELVRYSFAALEAWGAEQNCERPRMQTPIEFGQRLADEFPDMAAEVRQLVRHYAALAYAELSPPASVRPVLERLWRHMSQIHAGRPATAPA